MPILSPTNFLTTALARRHLTLPNIHSFLPLVYDNLLLQKVASLALEVIYLLAIATRYP